MSKNFKTKNNSMNRIVLSKSLVYSIILWSSIVTVSAQVSQKIGGNPGTIDPKAVLELESTTKGFLLPRMTAVQVAAIANPTSGMIVFCTDCGVGADGELRISYNGVWQTYKGNVTGDITGNAATVTTNANLSGPITSSGNTTSVASQTGTGSTFVMDTSPTLVTPVLGVATATSINNTAIPDSKTLVVTTDKLNVMAATSSSELAGVISDETGTGSVVLSTSPTFTGDAKAVTATAGDNDVSIATTEFVTSAITTANATNANLTGAVTSTGNTTSLGSFTSANLATALSDETGTGVAVLATSPTLVTPVIGAATGTSLSVTGQLTSTVATGTAPLVVTSTTPVANLSIGGNAATVTTNANLTGVVTSTGNATAIADGALSIAKTNGLQTAIDGKVADAINDATTTVAPSQNAVFDALALKANLASPTFTGTPVAPTAAAGTNTTQVATTEFVTGAIATATIPDATTSAKGKIQLAGDLAGTADLPVVAANAITTSKILDANVTDAKIATVSGSKVTGNITGSAANITGTVAIANGGTGLTSVPANGQIDIGNGTGFTRATLTAGSGITITNNAGAITISAAVRPTTDQTIVTTAAQTSFTLSEIPVNAKVWMFINGVRTNNLAYSISGTTVTYTPSNNNSYELVVGDRIQFDYCY
jgi:hypothetical protein